MQPKPTAKIGGDRQRYPVARLALRQGLSRAASCIMSWGTIAVALIRKATGGVHVAFEVTGVPQVLAQCIDATWHEGLTLIVSIWETDAGFRSNTVVLKERQLQGTIAYRNVYPALMERMTQGHFSADKLVTRRIAIDDIVDGIRRPGEPEIPCRNPCRGALM